MKGKNWTSQTVSSAVLVLQAAFISPRETITWKRCERSILVKFIFDRIMAIDAKKITALNGMFLEQNCSVPQWRFDEESNCDTFEDVYYVPKISGSS